MDSLTPPLRVCEIGRPGFSGKIVPSLRHESDRRTIFKTDGMSDVTPESSDEDSRITPSCFYTRRDSNLVGRRFLLVRDSDYLYSLLLPLQGFCLVRPSNFGDSLCPFRLEFLFFHSCSVGDRRTVSLERLFYLE